MKRTQPRTILHPQRKVAPALFGGQTAYGFLANRVGITGALACGSLLVPRLIELDGSVLLEMKAGSDGKNAVPMPSKKEFERYNNVLSLPDIFLGDESLDDLEAIDNHPEVIDAFGDIVVFCWDAMLSVRFPQRFFRVEIGEDLLDEEGLCVTFSEAS